MGSRVQVVGCTVFAPSDAAWQELLDTFSISQEQARQRPLNHFIINIIISRRRHCCFAQCNECCVVARRYAGVTLYSVVAASSITLSDSSRADRRCYHTSYCHSVVSQSAAILAALDANNTRGGASLPRSSPCRSSRLTSPFLETPSPCTWRYRTPEPCLWPRSRRRDDDQRADEARYSQQ